jgi:hypothetical protein
MKKVFFCIFCVVLLISFSASAQSATFSDNSVKTTPNAVNHSPFKPLNPDADKIDQYDIQGIKGTTFTVSNTSDGSANSYKHTTQIIISLLSPGLKSLNPLLIIFYSEPQSEPYAVTHDGPVRVYYPISMYSEIKQQITDALAAKTKITLKVTVKNTGYREGTLVF